MINVVLASDENYFPGLSGALLSVAFNTRTNVNIIVIDGGIKDESWNKLYDYVTSNLKHITLSRLKPDLTKLFKIGKKDNGGGVNAYVRVLVGSMLPDLDSVVYIDSDFYFGKDIAELNTLDFEGKVAVVVRDVGEVYLKNDCPVLNDYSLPADAPYFNSGFMVIDLNRWRKEGIEEKTLDLLYKHSEKFRCYDQTALNISLFNKVKFVNLEWNDHRYYPLNFIHESLKGNFHMFGPYKPWLGYPINSYYFLYQLILRKIGMGNLGYRRFQYRNYYKIKLATILSFITPFSKGSFWSNVLVSRKKVKDLYKNSFSKV